MAVLIDAAADALRRTTNLHSTTTSSAAGWVYLNATAGSTIHAANGETGYWLFGVVSGALYLFTNGGDASGSAIVTGRWYHVALTKNGTSMIAYLDGHPDIIATNASSPSTTGVNLGNDNIGWGDYLNGALIPVDGGYLCK